MAKKPSFQECISFFRLIVPYCNLIPSKQMILIKKVGIYHIQKSERRLGIMILNLTEEERNYVKITYNAIRFEVNFGRNNSMAREYFSVDDMMKEFQENGIERADFDDEAHRMFNQALNNAKGQEI